MALWLNKALLMYLTLAIAFSFANPQLIFGDSDSPAQTTVLSWFNLNRNDTSANPSYTFYGLSNDSNNASNSLITVSTGANQGIVLSVFDGIAQIIDWFKLIFAVLFSPVTMLTDGAMSTAPPAVLFVMAIPLVFILLIGLVMWIRGIA